MKTKLEQIYSVFNNTEIDEPFVESAISLNYAEYFTNLDLNENDNLAVDKCYLRVIRVINNIPMSLLPTDFVESFYKI
ncbi:MAG: hypothetical protein R6U15_08180 [Candidatus Izemoplasmatales bacterium]